MEEWTQQEVLDALKDSGREGWTRRLMISLREEGFLPSLKRRTKPGTNAPHNVWEESDLQQIVDAYDLWVYYDGRREPMARALWLEGYTIPLRQLRDPYLPAIEKLQQHLTQGETELDDILMAVSEVVVRWSRKYRYSPQLTAERKKIGVEQMERFIEPMLVALAVSEQKESTLEIIQSFLDSEENPTDQDDDSRAAIYEVASILRDILTLPNLHEILETATLEQWEHAREDYLTICKLLGTFSRQTMSEETLEELAGDLKLTGAMWLILPLLSARFRGHGHWIDKGFDKAREFFASPTFLAFLEQQRQKRESQVVEAS